MVVTEKSLTSLARTKLLSLFQKVGTIYTLKHFTAYSSSANTYEDEDYGIINRTNYGSNAIFDYETYYIWGYIHPISQPQREERWMRTIIGDQEYYREILYLYPQETGGTELVRGTHINSDDQVIDDLGREYVLDTCQPWKIEDEIVYYSCILKPKVDKK